MNRYAYKIAAFIIYSIELVTDNLPVQFGYYKVGVGSSDISEGDAIIAPEVLETSLFNGKQCCYVAYWILLSCQPNGANRHLLVALRGNIIVKFVIGVKATMGKKAMFQQNRP